MYAMLRMTTWVVDERLKDNWYGNSDHLKNRTEIKNSIFTFSTAKLLRVPGHCRLKRNELLDAEAKEA